jgi:transcriptional regulator GlxA family with amidase domain
LARAAAMSRRAFHQAFLEQVGRTPGHELCRMRIERAKGLLATTGEKTEVIAAACGYPNSNSFWFAFRQSTGMSPKRYRQKFKR